ncbi:hypothetical protein HWV62_16174 [Athelia sp. TMB]|nr:hypothetical protein HWV62_16174 [Athelia sp. TMB]
MSGADDHSGRIVMGPTGSGKSTVFASLTARLADVDDYATNQDGTGVGHDLDTHTTDIRPVRCNHPNGTQDVVFVDTPGFDDENMPEKQVFLLISGWLTKTYPEDRNQPVLIVYLHRILDNRISGSLQKSLGSFLRMCGKGAAMHNVVFGTTMWKVVGKGDGARREQRLKDIYLAEAIQAGCEVKRFEDSKTSAWNLVDDLKDEPFVVESGTQQSPVDHLDVGNAVTEEPQPTLQSQDKLSHQDRIVVCVPILSHVDRVLICIVSLMGPTGAGKSTFIDYATKQNESSIVHNLSSGTSEIRAVRCQHPEDNRPVLFVDTPGFDDPSRSDIEVLSQIASWFAEKYKEKIPLAAIIYLHRISDNMTASFEAPLRNLKMFASMCGQSVMPNVVLGTTMWTEVSKETGIRREEDLKSLYWASMIEKGCKVTRFNDSFESVWEMVGTLATQEFVILPDEWANENQIRHERATGLNLNAELKKLFADQDKAARELQELVEMSADPVVVEYLLNKNEEIQRKITSVKEQIQNLRIPWRKRIAKWLSGLAIGRSLFIRDEDFIAKESSVEEA